MTRLEVYKDNDLVLTLRLGQERLLIGRSRECDVQLPDRSISRIHARLARAEDGRFWIEDASTNGTRVNWAPLQARVLLEAGSRIYIGDYVLVLELEENRRHLHLSQDVTGFLPVVEH